jgi:hypothetical protein
VLGTSFVTSHTSTAFTLYMRCNILFSASKRHSAWVICSQNRRLQNDLTRDKHPRKPTHNVRKNRKDARKFRS